MLSNVENDILNNFLFRWKNEDIAWENSIFIFRVLFLRKNRPYFILA
jgi:hypothetical protein